MRVTFCVQGMSVGECTGGICVYVYVGGVSVGVCASKECKRL